MFYAPQPHARRTAGKHRSVGAHDDHRFHRRMAAFTMVEMVVVMLIMGIFAAAAVPTFYDSLLFHRVESAARRVKADLELVRQTARLTSAEQTFTVLGNAYSASSAVADLDRPTLPYSVDLSKPPYSVVVAANFGGFTEVRFNGYGTPLRPNGTPLVSGTVVVHSGNHQCTVTLDGTTGQVTISSNHTRARTAKVISM